MISRTHTDMYENVREQVLFIILSVFFLGGEGACEVSHNSETKTRIKSARRNKSTSYKQSTSMNFTTAIEKTTE